MPKTRPTFRKTFIKQWREHRSMTVEKLALEIGMTGASVSRIENGKQPYTQPVIEAIANALDTDVPSLLEYDPISGHSVYDVVSRATPEQRAQIARVAEAMIGYSAKKYPFIPLTHV